MKIEISRKFSPGDYGIILFVSLGLDLMKRWHKGHNEYFSHLEHVAKLPEVWRASSGIYAITIFHSFSLLVSLTKAS